MTQGPPPLQQAAGAGAGTPVRVLIVDDSAMIRKVLSLGLSSDPRIAVAGLASSAAAAALLVEELRPDVLTLDLEMPGMDGLSFLRDLMGRQPLPVVVISALTQSGTEASLRAMEAGAVDVIAKPSLAVGAGLPAMMEGIASRVLAAAGARVRRLPPPSAVPAPAPRPPATPARPAPADQQPAVIAIGASTGGVQALTQILPMFPPDGPPVLIVQHMPQGFTAAFARRLATICRANVREAVDGERLERGTVLIAPGGPAHMQIRALRGGGLGVALTPGAPVCYSRPSIDVLFTSVAAAIGARAAAAILTGMGRDGAEGMGLIRRAGGLTLAQEASGCIVNGMPQAAWDLGAAMERLPLESIPDRLLAGQPLAPAHPTLSRMHTLRSGADHG